MTLKVSMLPHITQFRTEESGIRRVVEAYFKHLPQFDIELVDEGRSYDVLATHAGMTGTSGDPPDVAHLHGLYWSADYQCYQWEFDANARIIDTVRKAKEVTVPSAWVGETFQRDMRFSPHIIPHGIEWDDWQHDYDNGGFVLWNKNRVGDVCSPEAVGILAERFTDTHFVTTFGFEGPPRIDNQGTKHRTSLKENVTNTGLLQNQAMKQLIQQAGVYLSTTKETWGIGVLEAMAAGVPVLGWNFGGNKILVQHGVNGYLARPDDYDDLSEGLLYCLKHRKTLGANGRELARKWTWEAACEKVAGVYRLAAEDEPASVSVVIPCFNGAKTIGRAIESIFSQTFKPKEIVVIDDGSTDNSEAIIKEYADRDERITYRKQQNSGVSSARNAGISLSSSRYITCLDKDDWLERGYLETAVDALEADSSLGIAYTRLNWYSKDGDGPYPGGFNPGGKGSHWPHEMNYDKQFNYTARQNQIPSGAVFRRKMWERTGGYRSRYEVKGCGSEDANFWTRGIACGFGAKMVSEQPLLNYTQGGSTSNPDYREPDWLAWHPWTRDGKHPFASYATPKNFSHPVRQYDEPLISVIIPVGPGHEKDVINALDSLEGQTFRNWEAVVVWDAGGQYGEVLDNKSVALHMSNESKWLCKAYPYIRLWHTGEGKAGPGAARNQGVKYARAPLIFYLDADDTLYPDCLEKYLRAWNETGAAIYSDYVGHAFIEEELAQSLQKEGRLKFYNPDDEEAIVGYKAFDFDCERAQRQPEPDKDIYCFNLISTLFPKLWHQEIGGFDEEMETWEDIDYWLRMSHRGHCFYRLSEELVRYRFYSGERRYKASADTPQGRQTAENMVKYLSKKYKGVEMAGCSGCGKKKAARQTVTKRTGEVNAVPINDSNFVKATYIGSAGNHHVIGAATFPNEVLPGSMRRKGAGQFVINYGYISRGVVKMVHINDLNLMRGKWQELVEAAPIPVAKETVQEPVAITSHPQWEEFAEKMPELQPLTPPDTSLSNLREPTAIIDDPISDDTEPKSPPPFDLNLLPGVTPAIGGWMREAGIDTPEAIQEAGSKGLVEIKGVGPTRAKSILKAAEEIYYDVGDNFSQ